MTIYSQYRTTDGTFTSHVADVLSPPLDADGVAWKEGHFHYQSQRVDLETGAVVPYQATAPGADHEWDPAASRWRPSEAARAREGARASATAQISALEAKQGRALRELALGYDGARERLDALDKQIIELRAAISVQGVSNT